MKQFRCKFPQKSLVKDPPCVLPLVGLSQVWYQDSLKCLLSAPVSTFISVVLISGSLIFVFSGTTQCLILPPTIFVNSVKKTNASQTPFSYLERR